MYFLTQTIILSSFFIFLHQCILECFENKAVEKVMYKMCVYKDCSPEIMKYVHVCPDYFILIGLPLKSFASPFSLLCVSHFPVLITITVWTSVEFRCETFASLWRIKHAMSWPFVCRAFHSTGRKHRPKKFWENVIFCYLKGKKKSEKTKHIIQIRFWFSRLFFSALLWFLSVLLNFLGFCPWGRKWLLKTTWLFIFRF